MDKPQNNIDHTFTRQQRKAAAMKSLFPQNVTAIIITWSVLFDNFFLTNWILYIELKCLLYTSYNRLLSWLKYSLFFLSFLLQTCLAASNACSYLSDSNDNHFIYTITKVPTLEFYTSTYLKKNKTWRQYKLSQVRW